MKVDYVTWLRSRVGHQKVFLVRACGIVTDAEGRVLLQRHPDWGWWELPGGPLEPGERLSACLVRGLRETGLTVEPARLVGLYTSADFDLTYPNEDYAANTPAASFRRGSSGSPISHEHILHLRQFVGRERLMITGGAGLVRNEAGQVLFIRRSDDGMWALPAGAMELGERVDRAVEREVGEETGLVVRAERLIGVYAGGPAFRHTYPNGDQTVLVSTFFDCRVMGGALCADNDEADGLAGREAACFQ
jgi:ADP-ribose pyrophosphatase YjhB (NUDIX family)